MVDSLDMEVIFERLICVPSLVQPYSSVPLLASAQQHPEPGLQLRIPFLFTRQGIKERDDNVGIIIK